MSADNKIFLKLRFTSYNKDGGKTHAILDFLKSPLLSFPVPVVGLCSALGVFGFSPFRNRALVKKKILSSACGQV